MGAQVSTAEKRIAWIASRAHGIVDRRDLYRAGLTRREIGRRIEKGLLIPEFRGVYRVGHAAPSPKARYMAAVKAGGPGALLCGPSAAYLESLLKCPNPPPPEVWCPTARRVPGVRTRRSRTLDRRDRTEWDAIPATVPARTLVDVAPALSDDELMRAVHEAQVRYRTTPDQVEAVLARIPNPAGARRLRQILHGDTQITLSALERAFLELLRRERLPLPLTNKLFGGRYVDCRWPEHRLTVELLGYRFHSSRHAWEQDHLRAQEARDRRDRFRRYTWDDILRRRERTEGELRELLAGSG
jgi:hypothetical protein